MGNVKRIAFWTGPRDAGTALMYAFNQRKDTVIADEPYFAYSLAYTGVNSEIRDEAIEKMDVNPQRISDLLANCDIKKELFVVRNKASQLIGLEWSVLESFKNVFLISEPEKMVRSLRKDSERPTLIDMCYEVQYQQILYLIEKGVEPIVIKWEDILDNPELAIKELCAKLKISFSSEMLEWERGPQDFESLPTKSWAQNIHNSLGFDTISEDVEDEMTEKEKSLTQRSQAFYDRIVRFI